MDARRHPHAPGPTRAIADARSACLWTSGPEELDRGQSRRELTLWTTPPGASANLRPDGAWAAFQDPSGHGIVKAVQGISDYDTANVLTLTVPPRPNYPPVYVALAPAPQHEVPVEDDHREAEPCLELVAPLRD